MTDSLFYMSDIRFSDGLDVVEIKNGDQDKGGKTRIESAVVQDKAAVHLCGYGADNGAHKACQHTIAEAVLPCNGAKACCEGQSVDVGLGR